MVSYTSIEILLNNSNKTTQERDAIIDRVIYIETNWNEFTQAEYWEIIKDLENNQLDRIAFGLNYKMGDILKHIKQCE